MNRLEYAHEVWRQNEGYAIPETCQVFQDNFDSGIIYYNCNKYKTMKTIFNWSWIKIVSW